MPKPEKYPYSLFQKVAWGDMDAFGHVNNVVYAKYFETARASFFEERKLWESPQKPNEGGPVITHIEMDYRKQVRFPETIEITIKVESAGNRSFSMLCTMWNAQGECVLTGHADFLWFNFLTGRPTAIPDVYKEHFFQQAGG
ncbi:acyl-CoA thioester hydrolase, YbgC/YbaW family [Leptospira broomii serovar Hurstbridge str. 5399]|uniref:Acyl-CoA thioester hydrolase, YbgC/YbaW family n=1 Tax=Leptospira broomii serovar Hurstbridge str. 5399 TaxID=1049789 RepID=T0GCZ9_9LEPT|nr:acyl-CoA thioesterase [Leptospira broomii]EQA44674.1 acyl-CoA thioester hydrolase, YbgC/YbaW family [Leptospira broomii serovar Hurstbridge str. 5399]